MLDVRRMQVLRAVVSSGSVTAAAAHLGYTPSAVSQQIAALEKQAGIALLERVGRGVRPTAAGRLLTEHAEAVSRQLAEAETALAELRAGRTGRIAVRYFTTAGSCLVAPAVAELRARHPGVRIDLRHNTGDPLAAVAQGEADLALLVGEPPGAAADGLQLVHLLDDPYRAVLPADHPLAAKRVLDLADLAGQPWVGCEPAGPCVAPVVDACAAAGFSPDQVVTGHDYATARGFVAAGLGVALMPRLAIGGRDPGVAVRPVRNPEPIRVVHVAVRSGTLEQPALRALLAALRSAAAGQRRQPA